MLIAAKADIGAARAAFFPWLSLTASLGYTSSLATGSLFDGAQRAWRFALQLSVPLISAGRLRFELRLAEVRESSAVVAYERAIEPVFREVADGLAERETFAVQLEAQARTATSAEHRTALSGLHFRAGPRSTSNFSMHGARFMPPGRHRWICGAARSAMRWPCTKPWAAA